jgi:hypothetical protein
MTVRQNRIALLRSRRSFANLTGRNARMAYRYIAVIPFSNNKKKQKQIKSTVSYHLILLL